MKNQAHKSIFKLDMNYILTDNFDCSRGMFSDGNFSYEIEPIESEVSLGWIWCHCTVTLRFFIVCIYCIERSDMIRCVTKWLEDVEEAFSIFPFTSTPVIEAQLSYIVLRDGSMTSIQTAFLHLMTSELHLHSFIKNLSTVCVYHTVLPSYAHYTSW